MINRLIVLLLVAASAFLLALSNSASASIVIPNKFPLFKQCDPRWGSNQMGGDATICQQGCAMSCVAMALNGYNITIDGEVSNPGVLNQWLIDNKGYLCIDDDCNNLRLDAPEQISSSVELLGEMNKPDIDSIIYSLDKGYVFIAHVRDNSHFVLVTGYDTTNSSILYVNDPFYSNTFYEYDTISDMIMYKM